MDFDDELDNIIDEAKGLKGDMTGKKLEFKVIKVKKSPCDDREYRELLMENNMKVLLIHDEAATEASVSLDLNSGWIADPITNEGLS